MQFGTDVLGISIMGGDWVEHRGTDPSATGVTDTTGDRDWHLIGWTQSLLSEFYGIFDRAAPLYSLYRITANTYAGGTQKLYYQWANDEKEWRGKKGDTGVEGTGQVLWKQRIKQPLLFERQAFGDDPFASTGDAISFGQLKIHWAEEDDDGLLTDLDWTGATLDVYIGLVTFGESEFEQIAALKIESARWTEDELTLIIQDPDVELQKDIQTNLYLGTGGITADPGEEYEGFSDLEGVPKPLCYGKVFHIQPVEIDREFHVYQIHDGMIQEVVALYDGGIPYADPVTDTTDLYGEPLSDAQWATDLANGRIRLANNPAFVLTADVRGSNDTLGAGYVDHVALVAQSVIVDRTTLTEADVRNVGNVDALVPYESGVYVRSGGRTVASVVQELLAPVLGYPGYNRTGDVQFGIARVGKTNGTLREQDIIKIRRSEGSPLQAEKIRFGYQRNYTRQDESGLGLAVDDAYAEFAAEEYRSSVQTPTGTITSNIPRTLEPKSLLTSKTNADIEAVRQVEIAWRSHVYLIEVRQRFLKWIPGDTVVVEYPRFGLDNGVKGVLLGVRENAREGRTVLRWWTGTMADGSGWNS